MGDAVREAAEERLRLGYSKEQIVREFIAAGYSEVEAGDIVDTVAASMAAPAAGGSAPASTSMPPAEPTEMTGDSSVPDTEGATVTPDEVKDASETSGSSASRWSPAFVFGIGGGAAVLVLLLVGVASGGVGAIIDRVSFWMSPPPFATEGELMTGLLATPAKLQAYPFAFEYALRLEPRASSTPALPAASAD